MAIVKRFRRRAVDERRRKRRRRSGTEDRRGGWLTRREGSSQHFFFVFLRPRKRKDSIARGSRDQKADDRGPDQRCSGTKSTTLGRGDNVTNKMKIWRLPRSYSLKYALGILLPRERGKEREREREEYLRAF